MSSKTDDLLIIFVRADGAMGGLEHSARLCIETEITFFYTRSLCMSYTPKTCMRSKFVRVTKTRADSNTQKEWNLFSVSGKVLQNDMFHLILTGMRFCKATRKNATHRCRELDS